MLIFMNNFTLNFFFFFKASGRARSSFTSMSLADINENNDINHQREVIKDTAAMVFAGITLHYNFHVH